MSKKFTEDRFGINFGFNENKFYIDYQSSGRIVGNLKEEFKLRAIELCQNRKKLMLGISSGLDSQAVMSSFINQGLDIDYAFLYFPGFNEDEYFNLKILEKKFGFKSMIVDIDPEKRKEEVIHLSQKYDLPYSHILHKLFLEQLPRDIDFIQGIHGPDLYLAKKNRQWYILESAGSAEISRLRSFLTVENRTGKIIGWERIPEILLSILTDEVTESFIYSYNYISQSGLIYRDGKDIPIIDHWDLYIKPFLYGKYWKDELLYFPKSVGYENIDYVLNGPKHKYRENLVLTELTELIDFLKSDRESRRYYQNFIGPIL